ncbi:MAG: Gfo/Idh/MocA family oxidoreductase [Pseudomonadota bacterium]
MADKPFGIGIVGTGRIADLHAIEYRQNPDAKITALCDQDVSLAKGRAKAWDAEDAFITDDIDALLARNDVDLVEILLPHHLHLWGALKSIEAGKIVSLQKPMCVSLAEADQLVAAAESADRPLRIFENFLFHPPVVKALELVENGAIGEPVSMRIKSNPGRSKTAWKVPESATAWRQDRAKSGGGPLIFDDGHHKFALAWRFMGEPDDVHAFIGQTKSPAGEILDAPSIVSFRFPGNRIGHLEVVYSPELEVDTRQYPQDDRIEITGTKGVLWVHGGHGRLGNPPPVEVYANGVTTRFDDIETAWEQSFVLSTRSFLEALRKSDVPALTPDQGRQVLRFAFAAEESAKLGQRVKV